MTAEQDAMRDAILHGRDRREEIKAEWEALGMAPRIQSPAELRRVLMTWDKASLVTATIRAESEEIKAQRQLWESQEARANTLILPPERKQHRMGYGPRFDDWARDRIGENMSARDVFAAGWAARTLAAEAADIDGETVAGLRAEVDRLRLALEEAQRR